MRIVIVSTFYSEGMGYTENCLPRALANLGHEVHLITSNLNVYGTSKDYDKTYKSFLGPADQGHKCFVVDRYTVHRLKHWSIAGYVAIKGLASKVREINPHVVHCIEMASLQSFLLASLKPFLGFKFFTESHQHLSVMKPYLRQNGFFLKKAAYKVTRTLPTYLASLAAEKCYAIAPDCVHVATKFYGVPKEKTKLRSLGTDTQLFRPAITSEELASRSRMRIRLGYSENDIVCVYSGRFSVDKNPLLLARAVEILRRYDGRFHSLFVGEGPQKEDILRCKNAKVLPFLKYSELAELYRAADIAVWPRQESMSMLDAAASGLPLIVSADIGESERVAGSGTVYQENNVEDMVRALSSLSSNMERQALGTAGREKMSEKFSWTSIAQSIASDYAAATGLIPKGV